MIPRNFIIVIFLILPFMGHGQRSKNDSEEVVVQDVQYIQVEDDVESPPLRLISKFKTLQNWLVNICDNDKPKKPIMKYKFGLFESPNDYTLVLVGVNTYDDQKSQSSTRIEFGPTNMYFKLPKGYYENLSRDQLLNKLTSELKSFANTKKFKTSFFTESSIIYFETNGVTIWSKQ
jgi:hypothetical protein